MNEITTDEWLEAFQLAYQAYDKGDGMTTEEIAHSMNVSLKTARVRIKQMFKLGTAQRGSGKLITAMDGKRMRVPSYKLMEKANE